MGQWIRKLEIFFTIFRIKRLTILIFLYRAIQVFGSIKHTMKIIEHYWPRKSELWQLDFLSWYENIEKIITISFQRTLEKCILHHFWQAFLRWALNGECCQWVTQSSSEGSPQSGEKENEEEINVSALYSYCQLYQTWWQGKQRVEKTKT